MRKRLRRSVDLWIDLFARHRLLDHAGLVGIELDELLRADATRGERRVLHLLFGVGKS